MSLSQDLDKEVLQGMNPETTVSIPVNLGRVGEYIEIAKNTMILIGGEPTAGKTTLAQTTFIVDPIDWYVTHQPKGMKLSIISFLMERKMTAYTSRWISRKIFEDHGENIHPKRILGKKNNFKLTKGEYELVQSYYKVLDLWEKEDLLIASQGSKNPSGISMFIEAFARKYGTIHDKDKTDKSMGNILASRTYEPHHPNHIVLIIGDNASVLDQEKDLNQTGLVNKFNRTMMHSRDNYGFSPVLVQHLNRDVSSTQRRGPLDDIKPKLSDFADSSQTQKSADIVMAMFNPASHMTKDTGCLHNCYDMNKMRDDKFRTYYRSLYILKNNFDAENLVFPLAIHPTYGNLKPLPKPDREGKVLSDIYERVLSGKFFLENGEQESIEEQVKKPFKIGKKIKL